jgi:heme exporter protein A
LDKYKNIQVNFLSKGEIRKLELFRLVIEQKKLWILDEPYDGLDESTNELINETFKNHVQKDGMIFFSSHHYPELQNMDTINLENYANN